MKTLPIVFANFTPKDSHNALLRELLMLNRIKSKKILLINIPKQKPNLTELDIANGEKIDYSKKIKQLNKEFFGI